MHPAHVEMLETIARLGLALGLGSLIGFERQWRQKMAGLRTNALVALGACGFVVFGSMIGEGDPTRIAAQVVTGIGFLGAGVILREGFTVHGLNTAATLWCSAMVGSFAGGGFWVASLVAALFVTATNLCLRPLVWWINHRIAPPASGEVSYSIEVTCTATEEVHLRAMLGQALLQNRMSLRRVSTEAQPEAAKVRIVAQVFTEKRDDLAVDGILARLSQDPHVAAAHWAVELATTE